MGGVDAKYQIPSGPTQTVGQGLMPAASVFQVPCLRGGDLMLATGSFLVCAPVLDRPDFVSTASGKASSPSSADGCLPTCFPRPLSRALCVCEHWNCPCPCSAAPSPPECKCVLFWV